MKKRIYFLISASVQVVAFIFAIMGAKQIVATFLETVKEMPGVMMERTIALYEHSGTTIMITMAVIGILLNFLIIYFAINDKLLKKKGAVIACSIASFILAEYVIIKLLAVINIIVMIILKREKPEDFPVKKEIPKLKRETVDKKKVIEAVVFLAVYYSQFLLEKLIPDNLIIGVIISICFYVLLITLAIIIFKDLYKENFKAYKDNFGAYMRYIWPRIGIFYIIYTIIALIVFAISGGSGAANQLALEEMPILVLIPLAIIYAPLVEEALFRGCLRRFIKNDLVFIIISGIVFGLLHTMTQEATLAKTIIMAIPYATLGSFMAYLYAKSNNIFTNMTFHAFQNTLAVIITILMK